MAQQVLYPRGSWWGSPCPSPTMASFSSGIEAHSSPVEPPILSEQSPCYHNHRDHSFDYNSLQMPDMFGHTLLHTYEYPALCSSLCAASCVTPDSHALFQARTGADLDFCTSSRETLCEIPRNYRSNTHHLFEFHVSHADSYVFEPLGSVPVSNFITHEATRRLQASSNALGSVFNELTPFHIVLEALPLIDIEFSQNYYIDQNSNICRSLDSSACSMSVPSYLSTPAGVFPDVTHNSCNTFSPNLFYDSSCSLSYVDLGWLSSIPEVSELCALPSVCPCSVRVCCQSCCSVLVIEPCACIECCSSSFDVALECVCECCVHLPRSKLFRTHALKPVSVFHLCAFVSILVSLSHIHYTYILLLPHTALS